MRSFRFSLQMTRIESRQAWVSTVARAEELGYHMLVTADHLTACAPPLLALVAAADATTTMRLGTLVVNNDLRHPCVLAREVIALDHLCGGRVELGLGAGYAAEEYRRAGLRFDPAPVRIARLAESARLLRRLFDGEVVDHVGEHYEVHGERCTPRPVQAHIPLLVGGTGRTTLRLAARLADTVSLAGPGRDRLAANVDRQVAWIREAARAAGTTPEIQLLLHTVLVSPGPSEVEPALAARLPDLSPPEALASPYVLAGSPDLIAEQLLERRDRWGITHYTVRADAMTTFAPIIARLS